MLKSKAIFISYILTVVFLFFYSYTQVDLNLTLSKWSIWQVIQKAFQQIGWFQRPLSTVIYTAIIILLFIHYFVFLWKLGKNKLSIKQFWLIVGITSFILLFSYNAFSYDLFNYMFDARIVTLHGQDPYVHRALDYPGDPWINFMRWTHRTYPYGPVWLGLTVPLSFLGFQVFLPTLFLFKTLMVGSFLGTTYFIGRISEKFSSESKLFNMVFFAFNPLVIIESLVSAHNDIVMMFLITASLYMFLNKRYFYALMLFLLSVGVKFTTVLLLPVFIVIFLFQKSKKDMSYLVVTVASIILMSLGVVFAVIRTNFQPWYLLYILPFAAILAKKYYVLVPSLIITLFALLNYIPFLYLGNWDMPVPLILFWINIASVAISVCFISIWLFKQRLVRNK